MKILITGASGLLGTHLSAFLLEQGFEVVRHGYRQPLDVVGDLSDINIAKKLLSIVSPDIIINLIALTDVDQCEEDPDLSYRINVKPVENMVRWVQIKKKSCKLIQISTDQVYNSPLSKEREVSLVNYYGYSKFAADMVAQQIASVVLRTNFFGPRLLNTRPSYIDWIVQQIKEKKTIKTQKVFFSPVSIMTLTKCIKKVICQFNEGIFNIGSKEGMSKHDFILEIGRIIGCARKNAVEEIKRDGFGCHKARRPIDMTMNVSKFEECYQAELPTLLNEIESVRGFYDIICK